MISPKINVEFCKYLLFVLQLVGSTIAINCNEIYTFANTSNGTGTIRSKGYPNPYPENHMCSTLLKGDPDQRVMLKFNSFYLFHPSKQHYHEGDSTYTCDGLDTLRIYDGPTDKARLMGEYCWMNKPLPLMSSGNQMFLRLTSYTTGFGANGYSAEFSFVTDFGIRNGKQKEKGKCEFFFDSDDLDEGNVTSPNPDGIYPSNTNCTYIFKGNFLQRVYLNFHRFELEGIEPCTSRSGSDFLDFSNTHGHDSCPVRRCGQFKPQEIVSEGSRFRMTFHSNDRLNDRGFSATYKFITDDNLPRWANYLTAPNTGCKIECSFVFIFAVLSQIF